ncbi:unnamed protein product [Meloidogyne enterolobii]|uniref:Uncharacterized protein n=1 Tax=Meloidogyne enterolobii TaxID=390850 RepID=A0ACB0YMT7_MELEN
MGAADDGEYRQKTKDAAEVQKDKGFGKRSKYERLAHFNSQRELTAWWDSRRAKGETWRLNTRYDARKGATEYWHCAYKEDGIYICPARLRVVFRGHRGIYLYESKNREHDHTSLPPPKTGVGASETIVLEPYPLQTALIIDMTPRIVAHPPKKEMTSTTTEQTGSRETKNDKKD